MASFQLPEAKLGTRNTPGVAQSSNIVFRSAIGSLKGQKTPWEVGKMR